jgi:hypothetical protein
MAMGKRRRHARQPSMWVAAPDRPRSAAHPFYARLNQILDQHDFDGFVEGLCERFYAGEGRPGLPPGRYFRLLLIGVGTPRGLQGRLVTVPSRFLMLIRTLWEAVTCHRPPVRLFSRLARLSIASSLVAQTGMRELAFTTGCYGPIPR